MTLGLECYMIMNIPKWENTYEQTGNTLQHFFSFIWLNSNCTSLWPKQPELVNVLRGWGIKCGSKSHCTWWKEDEQTFEGMNPITEIFERIIIVCLLIREDGDEVWLFTKGQMMRRKDKRWNRISGDERGRRSAGAIWSERTRNTSNCLKSSHSSSTAWER